MDMSKSKRILHNKLQHFWLSDVYRLIQYIRIKFLSILWVTHSVSCDSLFHTQNVRSVLLHWTRGHDEDATKFGSTSGGRLATGWVVLVPSGLPAGSLPGQSVEILLCWRFHRNHSWGCVEYIILMKLKLIYDRQSVGQSVLVSGARLGPWTNFTFSLKFLSDICVFVIL
jgi:hypothetical protein